MGKSNIMLKYIFVALIIVLNVFSLRAVYLEECARPEDRDPRCLYQTFTKVFPRDEKFSHVESDVCLTVNPFIEIDWIGFDLGRKTDTSKIRAERMDQLEVKEFLRQKDIEKNVYKRMNLAPNYGFDICLGTAKEKVGFVTIRTFSHSFYIEYLKINPLHTGHHYSFYTLKILEDIARNRQNRLPELCNMMHMRTDTHNRLGFFASKLGYFQSTESATPVSIPYALGRKALQKSLLLVKKL